MTAIGERRWRLALVAPILFALGAATCGPEAEGLTLTEADSGRTISLRSSQRLVLELDSNPSTGFGWTFVGYPDAHVLRFDSATFQPPSGAGLVGAAGTEIWAFSAVAPGRTDLHLSYERPFGPRESEGRFDLVVEVSDR